MESNTPAHKVRSYARLAKFLVKHGRRDLVVEAGLDADSLTEHDPENERSATEFATELADLGPTFVKLGQLLSTRSDLLPGEYTEALAELQDNVAAVPFDEIAAQVESAFGVPMKHLYAEFDEEPMASASLGQVHGAVLQSGRRVVVKVQRPGIRESMAEDLRMLERLASLADKHTAAGRSMGFGDLLTEFQRSLVNELDYEQEARNLEQMRELTDGYDHLVVPEAINDLCRPTVLTMTRIDGRKVTDVGPLGLMDFDTRPMVEELFACYLRMILEVGRFHADPHPGNLLLTDDGHLALIDLGMVATVAPRVREQVIKLLLAIADADGDEAAQILAGLGHPLEGYDAASFQREISHLVSEAVNAGAHLQAGTVLMRMCQLSGQHQLRPPAEMSMIAKALLNLDEATLHLDPRFEPADAIRENLPTIMASGLKVRMGGVLSAAVEAKEFTGRFHQRANRIMDSLAEGEFRVHVDAIDQERLHRVIQSSASRLTLGIIIAAALLGAALMARLPTSAQLLGYPAIATVCFLFAFVAGVALGVWVLLTDRRAAKPRQGSRPRD